MKLTRILILFFVLTLALGSAALGEGAKPVFGVIDIADAQDVVEYFYPGQYQVMTFPTTNEVYMALQSGRVDVAQVTEDYANYLLQTDENLQYQRGVVPAVPLTMLTRQADAALTAALNEALIALKESGTLDALHETYIDGVDLDNLPEVAAAAQIPGAQEVIVGVSGDYPPHDFVSVSGTPAGFNVALMNEIAALAGINVKFETVTFGSKFSALESGRIDLFFLHAGYTSYDGLTQTEAYDEGMYSGQLTVKQK